MINFNANRQQFLSNLSKLLHDNGLECPLDIYENSPDGKQYEHDRIAFTIFRNSETWLIHIGNEHSFSTVRIVHSCDDVVCCIKINLYDEAPERNYINVLDWVMGSFKYTKQIDWYDKVLADNMHRTIHEREERRDIVHHTVNIGVRKKDKHTKVSLLFHGSESSRIDKVVLVFNVTNSDGRDDTYSVTLRNQSRVLNYLMGLYKREVYSKFLNEALDRTESNHDILGVYHVQRGDVVCISRPVANDRATYDNTLEIGRAYKLVNIERDDFDKQEWVTIVVDGNERQYNAIHFYQYRRT